MSADDVSTCAEMNELLAERASGPLDAAAAAVLDAHLARCAACRTAAAQWQALFDLVALPPPLLQEEAALRGLPERTLAAWHRRERTWRGARGALAAAGILAAAALPLWLWRPAPAAPAAIAAAPAALEAASSDVDDADASDLDSSEATADDTTLLDGLALEGDGAFALGDSG